MQVSPVHNVQKRAFGFGSRDDLKDIIIITSFDLRYQTTTPHRDHRRPSEPWLDWFE